MCEPVPRTSRSFRRRSKIRSEHRRAVVAAPVELGGQAYGPVVVPQDDELDVRAGAAHVAVLQAAVEDLDVGGQLVLATGELGGAMNGDEIGRASCRERV